MLLNSSTVQVKDSIAMKLLKVVFTIYLVVAISVTTVHLSAEYFNAKENLLADLSFFQTVFEDGLTAAVWNTDELQLKVILQGIIKVPIIVGVRVVTTDTNPKTTDFGIVPVGFEVGSHQPKIELLQHTFPVQYNINSKNQTIAQATFYTNQSLIFDRLQYGFFFILFNALIKTIALWVIFLWIGRRMLTRPLSILTAATQKVEWENLNDTKIDIHTSGKNELKVLEEAFNAMMHKLQEAKSAVMKNMSLELEFIAAQNRLQAIQVEHKQVLEELGLAKSQLIQAEKMSSLGQMVSGIAHEIGNPTNHARLSCGSLEKEIGEMQQLLMSVLQGEEAEELKIELEKSFKLFQECINGIKLGLYKITEISQSMRNYSRFDRESSKNVDIKSIVEESVLILSSRLKYINFETRFGETPNIQCFASHIGQVVMNILANAYDALMEKKETSLAKNESFEGKIRLTTKSQQHQQKEGIAIVIEDNGNGVPEELKNKILAAFFTTKPKGLGTGLGLAVSDKIIHDHHGTISIDQSKDLQGAAFTIWIPIDQDF